MAAQPPVAGRGPSYPFIDLPTAIGKAREMYEYAKRSSVHVSGLVDKWGYSVKSSSGLKTISALKYYGLTEETGAGESKTVKLTDRALRIIIDAEDSPERKAAIRDAALAPKLYRYCWDTWGKDMPADQAMRTTLVLNKGFVDSSALPFIKDYKATIEFAGLLSGDAPEESEPEGGDSANIEAESNATVTVKQPEKADQSKPLPPRKVEAGMRQDVFSVDEGAVTIEWPAALSTESLTDIQDWLEIVKRKIARSLSKPDEGALE